MRNEYKRTFIMDAFNCVSAYTPLYMGALTVVLIVSLLTSQVDAEVAVFVSDNYLEGETVLDMTDEDGARYLERERSWSNFQGIVPEGASVNSIVFRLAWTIQNRDEAHIDMVPVINPDLDLGIPTTSLPEHSTGDVERVLSTEDVPVSDDKQPKELLMDSEAVRDDTLEPVPTETIVPVLESSGGEVSVPALEPISMRTYLLVNSIVTTPVGDSSEEDVAGAHELVGEDTVVDILSDTPDIDENTDATTGIETNQFESIPQHSDMVDVMPSAEDSVSVSTSSTESMELPLSAMEEQNAEVHLTGLIDSASTTVRMPGMLEIRYSLDGEVWRPLGNIDYRSQSSVDLHFISLTLEDVPLLRVSARYVVSEADTATLSFDTVRLDVAYDVMIEALPDIETIISDQEPNFSISVIQNDITKEGIRAVVLERGGMTEFWYMIPDSRTEVPVWYRLAGDGSIQSDAPIGIKKRHIFWFDRNQEMLFGYAVDTQSRFGFALDTESSESFIFPFATDKRDIWRVIYDATSQTLRFEDL